MVAFFGMENYKSLIKTILSAGTESELEKRLGGMLKALTGCSVFESTFVMRYLSEGGLVFMVQDKGAPVGKSPDDVKPGRVISALCHVILNDSSYTDFIRSISEKANHGDHEDIRLHRQLTKAPHNLKAVWEWTKTDSDECLAILKTKPFFRERLYTQADA